MTQETVDAVVLAGGRNSAAMQAATGVTDRALVPLGGRTMLSYVTGALHGATTVERIFIVGDVPEEARSVRVAEGRTLMDNLAAGLTEADTDKTNRPVLVSTSDIPFVTSPGIDDFVARALATGADLCYPIVPIALCAARFPQMKRTTLRLREGTFTGGNMVLIRPQVVLGRGATIQRAYAARKNVWRMGSLLGWGLLLRIVLAQTVAPRQLSLPMLEAGVARLLGDGCRAAAVVTEYPEIGTDVDKPEDVAAAEALLGAQ